VINQNLITFLLFVDHLYISTCFWKAYIEALMRLGFKYTFT